MLSNVATLASAWLLLRDVLSGIRDITPTLMRLGSSSGPYVEDLRIPSRLLRPFFAFSRKVALDQANHPLAEPTRFGYGVILSAEEFGRAQQFLGALENSATQARFAGRNLLLMMNSANMASTHNVVFDVDSLNQQLNSILFKSPNLGEAMEKLRLAQQRAEDFVNELDRALRRN